MWNRIQYDDWTTIVPIIAFVCTFSVFLALTIRALLMKKKDARRMAHLPLEEQPGDGDELVGGQKSEVGSQKSEVRI